MIDDKVAPANGLAKKEFEELVVMQNSDRERVKEPEDAEVHDEDEERRSGGNGGRGAVERVVQYMGWRVLVAFWILGLCNNYGYVVMLSAAHDILDKFDPTHQNVSSITINPNQRDCNTMSTGAILLADIIPALLTKLVAPFFPLAVHVRMVMIIVLACAGFILVGAADNQWMAIAGVVCTAFSSGIGEATFLSYMPFFRNKNVISTWSSGTGGAGIFGSFSYALLLSLGFLPSTTMYLMLVVPALMSATFWILLVRPDVRYAGSGTENESSTNTVNGNGASASANDEIPLTFTNETFQQKLSFVPNLIKYMVPLGLVYFFEYLINQGLFELVYFDGTFINHKEQYRWYQVLYQVGVFCSRSSINIVHIKAIWVLAVLQGINVVLFGFEAVYSFVPSVFIVMVAVLWEGLLGGAAYVNTFHRINTEVPAEKREFSMAITTVADSLGITISGFLSMPIHNYICGLPRNMS